MNKLSPDAAAELHEIWRLAGAQRSGRFTTESDALLALDLIERLALILESGMTGPEPTL